MIDHDVGPGYKMTNSVWEKPQMPKYWEVGHHDFDSTKDEKYRLKEKTKTDSITTIHTVIHYCQINSILLQCTICHIHDLSFNKSETIR